MAESQFLFRQEHILRGPLLSHDGRHHPVSIQTSIQDGKHRLLIKDGRKEAWPLYHRLPFPFYVTHSPDPEYAAPAYCIPYH